MAGHDGLSAAAESILAAIELDAEARRRSIASGEPPAYGSGATPPVPLVPGSAGAAERLLTLVSQVVAEIESARARLAELNRALDSITEHIGVPVPSPPAPSSSLLPAPVKNISRPLGPGSAAALPPALRRRASLPPRGPRPIPTSPV